MDENPNHIPVFDDVSDDQWSGFLLAMLSVLRINEISRIPTIQESTADGYEL